jgi:hypothetical protein
VNGKAHTIAERTLTVADIVALAYGPNSDPVAFEAAAITVRERGSEGGRTLVAGETIEARDGLILNVVTPDRQVTSDRQAAH